MTRRNFAQTLRLVWIDAVLAEDAEINRADIERAFLISTPQASKDLALLRHISLQQIFYDTSAKTYRPVEGYAPIFSAEQHAAAWAVVNAVSEVHP